MHAEATVHKRQEEQAASSSAGCSSARCVVQLAVRHPNFIIVGIEYANQKNNYGLRRRDILASTLE